jgi:ubiquinone/menaquinone biosynthesis C-methylase UbiE
MRFRTVVAVSVLLAGIPRPALAQLGGRPAEEWIKTLDSPNRVAGLKLNETVAALKLKPGQIVADIGAGTGVFTVPLARAVQPGGTVYAVDIEQGLIDHIAKVAADQSVSNVKTVLGAFEDPRLPAQVDLAFITDVLHHIEKRDVYVKNLARYLKPGGRIAVIDFIPGKGGHRDDPGMQLSPEQVAAMMAQVGLKPVETVTLFDDKWFVLYGRQP